MRWVLIIAWKRWCAWQELEVHVAAVGHLGDIGGCTSERLLPKDLASKLLVAIVSVGDVRLGHQGLATTSPPFAVDSDDVKIPEATRRNLGGAQALLGLKLLFTYLTQVFVQSWLWFVQWLLKTSCA